MSTNNFKFVNYSLENFTTMLRKIFLQFFNVNRHTPMSMSILKTGTKYKSRENKSV